MPAAQDIRNFFLRCGNRASRRGLDQNLIDPVRIAAPDQADLSCGQRDNHLVIL